MKNARKQLQKTLALVCAACSFSALFGCASAQSQEIAPPNAESLQTAFLEQADAPAEDFIPVFRMAVCSDIHIGTSGCSEKFDQFFKTTYAYAANNETYQKVDAIVVTGDLTQNPHRRPNSYAEYRGIVQRNLQRETVYLDLLGNHDLYGISEEYYGIGLELYKENIGEETDRHVTANGFHLIALSNPNEFAEYTKDQIEWLNAELDEAAIDDPKKPIFTFQHQKVASTTFGSGGWNASYHSKALSEAYARYPQVVNFSGHSHSPATSPRSIWQGEFTALEAGPFLSVGVDDEDRFYYLGDGAGIKINGESFGYSTTGKNARYYRIVEVDAQNRVRIYTIDRETGEFAKTPSTLDDPETELIFEINDVTDPTTFTYTDARRDTAKAPYFEEGAELKIVRNQVNADGTVSGMELGFPQMQDEFCPYLYKIEWSSTDGVSWDKQTAYDCDEFLGGENIPYETVHIGKMRPGVEYEIKVTPVNLWGIEGEPLIQKVTAAKK